MSKIARRQFIQLSAVAAAGCMMRPGQEAQAQDMPKVEESDSMAQAMKYTNDASTVAPASRANPAPEQTCANCALVQGEDGADWRPCQIFPGKVVAAKGWCSVWAPKA
ncbi:MAG: high-potential iron-sulfur protein [Proteobacteria bacterium]|nr:high-potential iron-sulfur protein [Pseudomonadota bacterium]MDA0994262.1 high-potential iron-sulfur protein [Pseudomonadota bacterium]